MTCKMLPVPIFVAVSGKVEYVQIKLDTSPRLVRNRLWEAPYSTISEGCVGVRCKKQWHRSTEVGS
jgi:hypothetical protein